MKYSIAGLILTNLILSSFLLSGCKEEVCTDNCEKVTNDVITIKVNGQGHPNGIAVTNERIYVAIGGHHSNPTEAPVQENEDGRLIVYNHNGELLQEVLIASGAHDLVLTDDYVYIAHFSTYQLGIVSAISTQTFEVTEIGGGINEPNIMVPDALEVGHDGFIYVACNTSNNGWVARISTIDHSIDQNFNIPIEGGFACWVTKHPSEDIMYSFSWTGGIVQRNNISSGELLGVLEIGLAPHGMAFDQTGDNFYAMASASNKVLKISKDLSNTEEIPGPSSRAGFWGGPTDIDFSPTRSEIAFIAEHGTNTVSILNTNTLEVEKIYDTGASPIFLSISPSGETLAVGNNEDGTITIISLPEDFR